MTQDPQVEDETTNNGAEIAVTTEAEMAEVTPHVPHCTNVHIEHVKSLSEPYSDCWFIPVLTDELIDCLNTFLVSEPLEAPYVIPVQGRQECGFGPFGLGAFSVATTDKQWSEIVGYMMNGSQRQHEMSRIVIPAGQLISDPWNTPGGGSIAMWLDRPTWQYLFRVTTAPVPVHRWLGVDHWIGGRWCRSNAIEVFVCDLVNKCNGIASRHRQACNDLAACRSELKLVAAEHDSELAVLKTKHEQSLCLSEQVHRRECDKMLNENARLIEEGVRLEVDDWWSHVKELEGRVLAQEQERAIEEGEKIKAQREAEDCKRRTKYLERVLWKSAVSFNPVVEHEDSESNPAA